MRFFDKRGEISADWTGATLVEAVILMLMIAAAGSVLTIWFQNDDEGLGSFNSLDTAIRNVHAGRSTSESVDVNLGKEKSLVLFGNSTEECTLDKPMICEGEACLCLCDVAEASVSCGTSKELCKTYRDDVEFIKGCPFLPGRESRYSIKVMKNSEDRIYLST